MTWIFFRIRFPFPIVFNELWIGSVRSIVLQGGKIILKLSIRILEYRICLVRKDFAIINIMLENLGKCKRILNEETIIINYWIKVSFNSTVILKYLNCYHPMFKEWDLNYDEFSFVQCILYIHFIHKMLIGL